MEFSVIVKSVVSVFFFLTLDFRLEAILKKKTNMALILNCSVDIKITMIMNEYIFISSPYSVFYCGFCLFVPMTLSPENFEL